MARKLESMSRRDVLKKGTLTTAALTIGGTTTVAADTIEVSDNSSSIQAAVDAANPGDVVLVDGDGGPYREQVIVRKDLTVRGVNNPTLLAPEESLGVSDIAVIQPIFGAVGYGNEVNFEGFTVDGEFQTDKSGFYSCIGYYKADGNIRDLTATGADYGGYISQNRGGGGDQTVNVYDSHFEDLGLGGGVRAAPDIQLLYNEPGTTGEVKRSKFIRNETNDAFFKYGLSAGFSASIDVLHNSFEDFNGQFPVGFYAFNAPDCTVQGNEFLASQFPVYVTASSRVQRTGADEIRITNNSFDGAGIPDGLLYDSYGTTLFAFDTDDEDGRKETVNNTKIVNNEYSNLDFGVASFTAGDGVVQNTKIIRNEFDNIEEKEITDNGEETKTQANRI